MTLDSARRSALVSLGALAVGTAALAAGPSHAATIAQIIPPGAQELADLMARLRRAPRRRDFKTVFRPGWGGCSGDMRASGKNKGHSGAPPFGPEHLG
jgi:hypothetical protein